MHWKARIRAAATHLLISLLIAGIAALLVFGLWYAYPFGRLSGGRDLFLLLITVDVVLGPLLTFFVFNPSKSRGKLLFDFVVIACVQLAALGYGLHTVYAARPVYIAFEYDRFKIVHAADVDSSKLTQAPATLRSLPIWGPKTIALRELEAKDRTADAIFAQLSGDEMALRPEAWRPYNASAQVRALAISRPLDELLQRHPDQQQAAAEILASRKLSPADVRYLPVQSRVLIWTALLHPQSAAIMGYLPIDGFDH